MILSYVLGEYSFLTNTIYAMFLISITVGFIGTYITINRLNYLAGAIAHSSFGGIGAGYFLGVDPFIAGLFGAGISGSAMGVAEHKFRERKDAIISIIWAVGMALGIIFSELTPGYKPSLMAFIFGNILTIPSYYLYLFLPVCVLSVLFFIIFYNRILIISFDQEYAVINNINVFLYKMIIIVLVSLNILFLTKLSGLILVIALLTIPPTIAESLPFSKSVKSIIVSSTVISLFSQFFGLYLSIKLDISTGPVIILILTLIYVFIKSIFFLKNKYVALSCNH